MASQTLQLTRVLREQAVNTKSIVGEDNKLLGDMDTSMENNLGNLKNATMSVEDILKSSGSSQAPRNNYIYRRTFCFVFISFKQQDS